jgi:hypothetical protein
VHHPVGYLRRWDCDYRRHGSQVSALDVSRAEEHLALAAHVERLAAGAGVPVPERLLRRKRAGWWLAWALDAVDAGDRRAAIRRLARAWGEHAPALLDSRVPFVVLGVAGGEPGRRAVGRVRSALRRRGARTHLRAG